MKALFELLHERFRGQVTGRSLGTCDKSWLLAFLLDSKRAFDGYRPQLWSLF